MRRPQPYCLSVRPVRPIRASVCASVGAFARSLAVSVGLAVSVEASAQVGRVAPSAPFAPFDRALAIATVDSAWSRINQTYYDPLFHGLDWSAVRRTVRHRAVRAQTNAEVRGIVEGMFGQLGDSHFALIPAEIVAQWSDSAPGASGKSGVQAESGESDESDESSAAGESDESGAPSAAGGSLGEVGLEFRLLGGEVVVSRVLPRSAAADAGVGLGWGVERVGEMDVKRFVSQRLDLPAGASRRMAALQLPLSLMARTMGATGSTLRLTLRNAAGARVQLAIVRREVTAEVTRFGHLPPQVVRFESERFDDALGCVGVVRFNIWMTPVMPQLDDAMMAMQRCRGLVLDLRGNVGGVTAMMMGIAGYYLDSAVSLGAMTSRGTTLRYLANPRRSDRRGRPLAPFAGLMAILVDGLSVSTSEMFAAGMQDLARARVFGEETAGQALPAMLTRLPNGDVMQYVVGDYASPAGRRLEARGVTPDVLVPLTRTNLLAGRDAAMLAARKWIDERTERVATGAGELTYCTKRIICTYRGVGDAPITLGGGDRRRWARVAGRSG